MFEAVLEEHAFFKTMDPRLLEEIAEFASKEVVEAGRTLFRADGRADKFYAIQSGKVAVELAVPGREPVVIATLRGGDVLGWSWLLPPYRWRFDARVVEAAHLMVFDGARLRERCDENHELGYEVTRRIAQVVIAALVAERRKLVDVVNVIYGQPSGQGP